MDASYLRRCRKKLFNNRRESLTEENTKTQTMFLNIMMLQCSSILFWKCFCIPMLIIIAIKIVAEKITERYKPHNRKLVFCNGKSGLKKLNKWKLHSLIPAMSGMRVSGYSIN